MYGSLSCCVEHHIAPLIVTMGEIECSVNELVDDVLLKIFSYLPTEDLTHGASKVCKRWMLLIKNDAMLWKERFIPCDIDCGSFEFNKFKHEVEKFPHLKAVKIVSSAHNMVQDRSNLDAARRILSALTQMETFTVVVPVKGDIFKYVNPCVKHFSGVVLQQNYSHLKTWKNIEVLRLYETYDFTGRYLRVVADHCASLKVLSAVRSRGILTNDVIYFCEKTKEHIEEIELSGYGLQEDAFLSMLHCKKLRKLKICDVRLASKDVLLKLQKKCISKKGSLDVQGMDLTC